MAALSIWIKTPARITGALDSGLMLFAYLTAFQVSRAVVHCLTCSVVRAKMVSGGTWTHHPFAGDHCTLVTAAPITLQTFLWNRQEQHDEDKNRINLKGWWYEAVFAGMWDSRCELKQNSQRWTKTQRVALNVCTRLEAYRSLPQKCWCVFLD